MPPPFFADASEAAIKNFGEAVLWLGGLALCIGAVVRFFRGREATRLETPIAVAKHKEFAPLDRLERVEKVVASLRDRHHADMEAFQQRADASLASLRADIAEEFREVRDADARRQADIAALKAEVGHIVRQMQVLDAKVDHLPERILKLLGRSAS